MVAALANTAMNENTLLRSVLLHDKTGRIQAILPAAALLDLNSIKDQTGRDLVAICHTELQGLVDANRLHRLEPHPELYRLTTLIDDSVLQEELLFPASSDDDCATITVSREELKNSLLEFDLDLLLMSIGIEQCDMVTKTANSESDQDQIIHSVENLTTLRIKQRLEDTPEIPTLPQTAQRIIKLQVNPNALVSELAEIVESDPSLAAQVVSWAASPYYAAPGKIRSVQDAVVRVLGFDLVGNLALGLALGKTLVLPKDRVDGVTPYWVQSIYCSTLVEALAKLVPGGQKPSKGLTYLAGLLHNFGYLVLAHIFPPQFSQICRYMEANPHISHMAIEYQLLQITREQICVWLMQLWNMPEEVAVAIRHQHDPSYDGAHCTYPNLLFMATRLLRQQGIGDAPLEEVPDYLYEKYKLCPQAVAETVQQVINSADEIRGIAANFPE